MKIVFYQDRVKVFVDGVLVLDAARSAFGDMIDEKMTVDQADEVISKFIGQNMRSVLVDAAGKITKKSIFTP